MDREYQPGELDALRRAALEPRPEDEGFAYRDYDPIQPRGTDWRGLLRKIWAPLAALVGLAVKFGAFAIKFFGIFISVGAYALIWGWKFGVGITLLILVHELGHYLEARRQGLHPALPTFVPFLGAYVTFRQANDPWQGARIALAGPFVGGLGALACWGVGEAYDSRLMLALAYTGFFLNLFNLIPLLPFDGGATVRAAKLISHAGTYFGRPSRPRAVLVWTLYLGLALALGLAMWATHVDQNRL
jgi:Zn-dependent protease